MSHGFLSIGQRGREIPYAYHRRYLESCPLREVLLLATRAPSDARAAFVSLPISLFPSKKIEIVVWTIRPSLKRTDLTTPLDQCGTGVGQVLAMLYVVMTADSPRTILIDEPQSFLHPGAAKKLIDVLAGFPQHQYVIATHSPTIISACSPATVTLVRNVGGVSTLEQLETGSADKLRIYLSEVGATLSDVFGADNILWVEGATEEICFPQILVKLTRKRLMGTVIRGVRSTGDLEQKHAEAVMDIYMRLSGASCLLPPAIAFILDHELRTEQQKSDLKKRAKAVNAEMHFTKRRTYENYLLDARGIASVLNVDDREHQTEYSVEAVHSALGEKLKDPRYFKGVDKEKMNAGRESWAHAADLLHDLFSELTQKRLGYEKTEHSIRLTEWLLEHEPERFRELGDMLLAILSGKAEAVAIS